MEIPEHKRDDSKDYLYVLKSLNEIPFPVGRNLLADFLYGKLTNNSITKNDLHMKHNFGSLDFLSREDILEMIQSLINKGLIDVSSASFNKFIKVLGISKKGQEELLEPGLHLKQNGVSDNISNDYFNNSEILDSEERLIKENDEFLKGFNQEQKRAVVSQNNRILCVAGAGSGKTSVLTKRIEFLNKHAPQTMEGDKILAITFTRKAKLEMKNRLDRLGVKGVVIETFNSFCEKILLKNSGNFYGKPVRVANFEDKKVGILEALYSIGTEFEDAINKHFKENQKKNKTKQQLQMMFINDCFSVLDYFKSKKKDFEELYENIDPNEDEKDYDNAIMVYRIVKYLDNYMKQNGLRTYGDQINDCIEFFKQRPNKIPQFKHILVDEYQDVNSQQIEILDLLLKSLNSEEDENKSLFCVGDPRQSIFGWRGSDVNHILEFDRKYPDSEIINLIKNYRSDGRIVDLMNKSIRKMKMPELASGKTENESFENKNGQENNPKTKFYSFDNEEEEAEFVISEISKHLGLIPREEIFVLARTNKQLKELSEKMKSKNIPHIIKADASNLGVEGREKEVREGYITLSTVHSIKGMESEMVFVIGCNSINFPCRVSDHPIIDMIKTNDYDKEEEERRLFYVAISRAKKHLYITYSGSPTYFINKEMKDVLE